MKRLILSILLILVLSVITIIIIAYARGYRFNSSQRELTGTGLLVATSKPDGAQVYVDGELKTATNATINLDPGTYDVKIEKEGFQPWQKRLTIYKEVAAKTDAALFPSNPGLSPLTNSGALNPALSPDGAAIAFIKSAPEATPSASGIFVLELADRPLSFFRNPRRIAAGDDFGFWILDFEISLTWSPDTEQILAIFTNPETEKQTAYLLNSKEENLALTPVASIEETLSLWKEQFELDHASQIKSLPKEIIPIATASAEIISFSPDESKFLYRAKLKAKIPRVITPPLIGVNPTKDHRQIEPGNLYVYDLKEDRNYLLPQIETSEDQDIRDRDRDIRKSGEKNLIAQYPETYPRYPNTLIPYSWFPTSSHLLHTKDSKIKIMEYDGTNITTLYAGPFSQDFVASWPNGSKLVILTTLNPDADESPNLYAVKLR